MNYLSKRQTTFIFICLISIAILATSGCANVKPYADIGVAYQLDQNSDYWVQRERSWQCSNGLQAQLEAGLMITEPVLGNDTIRIGYHHESWINCGNPFGNKDPEIYQDDIRLTYQWVWGDD